MHQHLRFQLSNNIFTDGQSTTSFPIGNGQHGCVKNQFDIHVTMTIFVYGPDQKNYTFSMR